MNEASFRLLVSGALLNEALEVIRTKHVFSSEEKARALQLLDHLVGQLDRFADVHAVRADAGRLRAKILEVRKAIVDVGERN